MKIGITCYPVLGGSGIVATELGMALAAKGHQVHFISYQLPFRLDQFRENVFFHQVDISTYPLFKYPRRDPDALYDAVNCNGTALFAASLGGWSVGRAGLLIFH